VLAIVLCTTAVLGLAACAPNDPVLSPSATPSESASEAEATSPPPPQPVAETVDITCTTLISDQAIYDWGSGNFALDGESTPAGGLACRWINLTSQETLDVAVSIPTDANLSAAREAAATAGTAAPALGDAYFRSANDVGFVDVFSGGYWLTMQSTWFFETNDALPLVEAATAALPPLD